MAQAHAIDDFNCCLALCGVGANDQDRRGVEHRSPPEGEIAQVQRKRTPNTPNYTPGSQRRKANCMARCGKCRGSCQNTIPNGAPRFAVTRSARRGVSLGASRLKEEKWNSRRMFGKSGWHAR